jgi:hypothetical protein
MKDFLLKFLNSPSIATWMSLAIRIGGMAVLLPIVLSHFDLHQVLVWQLFSSISAMVLLIDFGFAPTFSRIVAVARGGGTLQSLTQNAELKNHGQFEKIDRRLDLGEVVGTQRRIYLTLSLVGILALGTLGTASLFKSIGSLNQPIDGWSAWALNAVVALLQLLNGSNASLLIGFDKITLLRRIESLVGLLQMASTALIILVGGNLTMIAANNVFWVTLGFCINHWQARLQLDHYGVTSKSSSKDIFAAVWPAAWRSGVGILFSAGIIQASGLIMPQLATAAEAATFLLVLRLITIASQVSQAPFYTKLPAMAKANAESQKRDVILLCEKGMSQALWAMAIAVAALVIVAPFCLTLIHSSVHLPDARLSILLGVAFFAERYGAMHLQIYTLSNHVIWHKVNGLTGIVMIIAFALLFPMLGVLAVPLAMICGYGGFMGWHASQHSLKFLDVGRWEFELATSIAPFLAMLLCTLLYYFMMVGH